MGTLTLIRHGESRWNLHNRFTGWVDVPLSERGICEAQECAKHCKKFSFDVAFTSLLGRAHQTLFTVLASQGETAVFQHAEDAQYHRWIRLSNKCRSGDIPVFESILLNERFYGTLQGMNKKEAERNFGKERVFKWRRGYKERPPGGETLKETFERSNPFLVDTILPYVKKGAHALIVAHSNTLRATVKYLEKIDDVDIPFLDFPLALPFVYTYRRQTFSRTQGDYRFDRPLR